MSPMFPVAVAGAVIAVIGVPLWGWAVLAGFFILKTIVREMFT